MGFKDDFNDNKLDSNLWSVAFGSVSETNGRLEMSCPNPGDRASVVTVNKYDLSDGYVKVTACCNDLNITGLYISPSSDIGTFPQFIPDSYGIELGSKSTAIRVYKQGNLVKAIGLSEPLPQVNLKIAIEGNKIKISYDTNVVLEEDYALESKEVYVYLAAQSAEGETGTGWFDDFELYTKPVPPTLQETVASIVNCMISMMGLVMMIPLFKSLIKRIKRLRGYG